MSKKRYVDTKFWDDNYIIDKDPIEKLLYLYLLTNTLTNISGIYEINIRRIAFDTGIDKEMVLKILERFEEDDKIKYKDGWVAIKNFIKYQMDNPKIRAGICYELKNKPKELVDFVETLDYKPTEKEFKRVKIHKVLRDKILKRDNYKCNFCGSKENLEIDHIVPVFQGGTNKESNLRVLCQSCNGKRNAGLRWNKEINGWTIDKPPKKMGRLSHPNPNPNPNPNTNLNKERDIKESEDSFSDKSKIKDNEPLEFSFEDKCWWGLYDWRIKMYQGAFPMLTVNYLFNDLWKTKFLSDPTKYKKMIKEKYEGDITKLVWAWLQQAKKFYLKDHSEYEKGGKLK